MSAITGICHLNGQNHESSSVNLLTNALNHRGPDGNKTWQEGPVGLGHCMLYTTPESLHEHLPLTSDDGLLTITADARIDNRDELVADLYPGPNRGIIPDSSLILSAYQRWGESCVEHLLGDFAFAIWDAQKQHLFCARDHMGVKPFYYSFSEGCFAFASEMRALFFVPGLPGMFHEEEIVNYLAGIYDEPEGTPFLLIRRLPAAHTLTISRTGLHLRCFWHPDPLREIYYNSDDEYESAFREIFTDAVRCRLRSAFPTGFLLSGGLDSSSVVSVARDIIQRGDAERGKEALPCHTFSALFRDVPACNEYPYIRTVLAKGGFNAHFTEPDCDSPLSFIPDHQQNNGDLLNDKNLLLFWQVYQLAQKTGVRTLVDGFFGDTTVSYSGGCLADLARAMKWRTVVTETAGISRHWHIPIWKIFWHQIFLRFLPSKLRSFWYNFRKYPGYREDDYHFISPHLARRYHLESKTRFREEQRQLLDTARELHYFDLCWSARQRDFENLDAIASRFRLDLRHPFSDRRLIEFCLALPPEQKIRKGYTRAILRCSLASLLPDGVRTRVGKTDLDLVFYDGIRAPGKIDLEGMLFHEPHLIAEYIDMSLLRKAYHDFTEGSNVHAAFLWRAAYLAHWLQYHSLSGTGQRSQGRAP